MNAIRCATIAASLSLTLATAAFAQGGGASGSPSNNPPGANTNNAGNVQPGGTPPPAGMTKSDGMDKPAKTTGMKKMRRSKAASAPMGSASMAK